MRLSIIAAVWPLLAMLIAVGRLQRATQRHADRRSAAGRGAQPGRPSPPSRRRSTATERRSAADAGAARRRPSRADRDGHASGARRPQPRRAGADRHARDRHRHAGAHRTPPCGQVLRMNSPEYGMQAFLWWRPEVASRDLQSHPRGRLWLGQGELWLARHRGRGQGHLRLVAHRRDRRRWPTSRGSGPRSCASTISPAGPAAASPTNGPPDNLRTWPTFCSAMASALQGPHPRLRGLERAQPGPRVGRQGARSRAPMSSCSRRPIPPSKRPTRTPW